MPFHIAEVIQVRVELLKDIINEYCGGVFPDFMSLDTEGLDEMILGSLKDCPSLPKVICTETWDYGLKTNHKDAGSTSISCATVSYHVLVLPKNLRLG